MTDFRDLGVVITGAGDSVGRVTAEKFLSKNAKVHICDIRADALSATLRDNPTLSGTHCDVGKDGDVDRLFDDALQALGKVDVLVNCVGIAGPHAPLEETDDSEWHTTLNVNVTGMLRTMKRAIPGMKERRFGVITNISSASTVSCLPNRTAYVVSKYAVEGLTKNAARELGPHNIRCNAILPGAINNERLNSVLKNVAAAKGIPVEQLEEEMLQYISMRSKVEPSEIADTILFLASDEAPHITGVLMQVSGGHEWEQ